MCPLTYISGYVRKFKRLVQLERREEMLHHEMEMKTLTGKQRERVGRAILNLRAKNKGTGLGGRIIVKFMKRRIGEVLPETEISVGDLVMLSTDNHPRPNNPTGTVIEKTAYSITVAFDSMPPRYLYRKKIRMDLYVNDITFQRMLDALSEVENAKGRLAKLLGVLLGYKEPEFNSKRPIRFKNEMLNKFQKNAVENAIAARDIYLIHGPPGTGKTVSCVEIIQQAVENGEKVIATADSNNAVDNIVEKLVERGVNVVRVGHPARVTPLLREHTLDSMIEKNPLFHEIRRLREEAFNLIDKRSSYTYPKMKWRRGMSDEKIKDLAKRNVGFRGVSSKKIKEIARWIIIQERINTLFENAEKLEMKVIDEILENADVVCTTNSTSGSELLKNRKFDLLVIDEATQSTEPSCLIPIIHANKIVMAGDHKQLPPTILNKEAERNGLGKSLFERLIEIYGDKIRSILRIQYRMNEIIMNFSNMEFYDNKLIADDSVKEHRLNDLITEREESMPMVFIDTSRLSQSERTRKGSTSKENPLEVKIVSEVVNKLIDRGIKKRHIGVISPYDDQIDLLKNAIPKEYQDELEIKTVDGFQGREKEVIILSLVRSNPEGNIGFLTDLRRLNVALTRAKRKLIIVGDSKTLSSHKTYKRLIEYIKDNGSIFYSVEEFRI